MPSAQRVAIGVVVACAMGFVAHRIVAPRPDASTPVLPTADVPVHAPARPVEPASPSSSPPGERVDEGLLLTRQCLDLAERDPLAAMDMALAQQLQTFDPGLLANLITLWARQDFEGAYAWIKTQEIGAWRNDMLARLAYLRAQTDPLAAARLAVTDISPGRARDEAIISVLHQWSLRDSEAAKSWADAFPDGKLKDRALAEIQGQQNQSLSSLTP